MVRILEILSIAVLPSLMILVLGTLALMGEIEHYRSENRKRIRNNKHAA
jgi:hypothetical protein